MGRMSYMKKTKNKRGVTLLELLVTIGISSIIIVAVVAVFASFIKNRRNVGTIQQSMENTRSALELMGKSLRMSCNITVGDRSTKTGDRSSIFFADQSSNSCIEYEFSSGAIVRKEYTRVTLIGTENIDLCDSLDRGCDWPPAPPISTINLTDNSLNNVSFNVQYNISTNEIPRITIKAETLGKIMQTTISSRNYYYLETR
jgi:prepilin-type N-terminal cleavage/methylation domain-containing protein